MDVDWGDRDAGSLGHRILVVDGEPGIADDYRRILCPPPAGQAGRATLSLEDELFGAAAGHENFPAMTVETCLRAPEAIESLRRAAEEGRPFSVAFVDPYGLGCLDGLQVVAELRALAPDLQIVIVSARCDLHPAELCRRVPPAHGLAFLSKPFCAAEIQHQALALTAKWQAERAAVAAWRPAAPAGRDGVSAVLDGLPAALMVFDPEDRLVAANGAMARLYPELGDALQPGAHYRDIQAQIARRLLPEDTLYRVDHWVRDRLDWHAAGGGVVQQRFRGGRWVMVAEARGGAGETYCQMIDVTALKQRESSRAQAARMTQMAQAFGALCERLHGEAGVPGGRGGGGKVVSLRRGAGGAMPSLVAKLQAVAQRQKLAPEALDPNREVARALGAAADLVSPEVEAEAIGAPASWPVLVDREGLRQALRELIANACEALEGAGRIELETANLRLDRDFAARRPGLAPGEFVRISVRDDGPGMTPELAERAFNPFYSAKPDRRHLGLGLSVAHGFVCQSGGHVELRDGDGPGTTVDIYLPRARETAADTGDGHDAIHTSPD